jgi:hypothetical protein
MTDAKHAVQLPPAGSEDEDLGERIEKFNKELMPLLGKYELGIGAIAQLTSDGRVHATATVISIRNPLTKDSDESLPQAD